MVRQMLRAEVEDRLDSHLSGVIASEAATRSFKISAWNSGHCPRKLWLGLNGAPSEKMMPRAKMVFAAGHATEEWLMNFLVEAGVPLIRTDPTKDKMLVPPFGNVIPDCYIERYGIKVIADVKSMSNFAFERTKRGEIDFGYAAQLSIYGKALGVEWGVLFGVRKETSHISFTDTIVRLDDALWQKVLRNHAEATGPTMPHRPYELAWQCEDAKIGKCVNGKTPKLGKDHTACIGTGRQPGGPFIPNFPCGYCEFKQACWGVDGAKVQEVIAAGEKPRWRVV
jgi:hypothetical protein